MRVLKEQSRHSFQQITYKNQSFASTTRERELIMGCILSLCRSLCFGVGGEDTHIDAPQSLSSSATHTDVPQSSSSSAMHTDAPQLVMSKTETFKFIEDLMKSSNTDKLFSSIEEHLKETLTIANLLFNAVDSFGKGSVLEILKKYKCQRDLLQRKTLKEKLEPQAKHHEFRIKKLSKEVQDLEGQIRWVLGGQIGWNGFNFVVTVALLVGSALLVIISKPQVFDQVYKALARLDELISGLLSECKSSRKGKKDIADVELNEAVQKLSTIRDLMEQTPIAIKKLDDIIAHVHEHMEVYIKSVEVNKNMETAAMREIKTGAEDLKTHIKNLEDMSQRGEKLKTEVGTVCKEIKKVTKNYYANDYYSMDPYTP